MGPGLVLSRCMAASSEWSPGEEYCGALCLYGAHWYPKTNGVRDRDAGGIKGASDSLDFPGLPLSSGRLALFLSYPFRSSSSTMFAATSILLTAYFALVLSLVQAESHTVSFNNKYILFLIIGLLYRL